MTMPPHNGVLAPAPGSVPTVLIGGMPAATVGFIHTCACPPPAGPHPPAPMPMGSLTVTIGGMPALRVMDMSACGAAIMPPGCPTVEIGG